MSNDEPALQTTSHMSSNKSKAELLKSAYEAFNRRDIEGILSTMHPDVDWPNAIEGGRIKGRDGIREYWQRQWRQN